MKIHVALHIPGHGTFWIDPAEKCAGPFFDRRTTGAKNAPVSENDYSPSAPAQVRAGRASYRRATGAPMGYEQSFSGDDSRAAPQQKTPEVLLKEAREDLAERAETQAHLDKILAPSWGRERVVKDRLRETYQEADTGALILNLDRRDERAPLFGELLDIAVEWGGVRNERKRVAQQIREFGRRIKGLEREIEKKTKKAKGKVA